MPPEVLYMAINDINIEKKALCDVRFIRHQKRLGCAADCDMNCLCRSENPMLDRRFATLCTSPKKSRGVEDCARNCLCEQKDPMCHG